MAAAIIAIRKKREARRARGGGKGGGSAAAADDQPPDWATQSTVFRLWTRFWEQTDIDDKFWSLQPKMSAIYTNGRCQAGVAGLIVGNFICTIVQMTIDPRDTRYTET